uniref:DNA helicase B n=1 Tax=Leptobrachium leishanense TaxID=445787 RepID=A0A8C5Q2L3_9ANUR
MSASRYRARVIHRVLQGQLLPDKTPQRADADNAGEEEDEDIEDSDPHFMDAEEIAGGGTVVTSWTPKKTRVVIKDNGVEHHVTGVFPLLDSWWSVTVEVKSVKRQYFTQGHPSYDLIEDSFDRRDNDGKRSLLSLFLRTCGVNPELVQSFLDWLPEDTLVDFHNLTEIIANYAKTPKSMDFTPYILNSVPGRIAMRAHDIPLVLRYLPRLLPRHVKSLLMVERKHKARESTASNNPLPDKLPEIEDLLRFDPWKLGFGLIVSKELHLYHCEASWENLCTCDSLLDSISDLQAHALIIYNKLKRTCYELGDTYMEQNLLTKDVSKDMATESAWKALEFLKDKGVVVLEGERVFLHNFHKYEKDIATYIHHLTVTKSWVLDIEPDEVLKAAQVHQPAEPQGNSNTENKSAVSDNDPSDECMKTLHITDCVPSLEKPNLAVLDEDQKKAVRLICSNPVTIISGKGGCGKTTIVSLVFRALIRKENEEVEMACRAFESEMNEMDEWKCNGTWTGLKSEGPISVLLTAPTGKAAAILKKKTKLPAATLHQVTCSYSTWKKQHNDNPDLKKEWKFSKVEVLVVDEGSLVSVDILSTALKLLSHHGKLAKLILLGDVRQLPSIQPGNLLADVFNVLDKLKWAVELRKNHRAESQLIVDNATRISQQWPVHFDAVIDLTRGTDVEMPTEDKKFILVALPDSDGYELQVAVEKLLARGPGLQDHKRSQFIAFRKNDCMLINELCCKHYSQHNIKNCKGKFEFQCKDKVCCTKNAYVKDLLTKTASEKAEENVSGTQLPGTHPGAEAENGCNLGKPKEPNDDERLCNGEVFFIIADVERDRIRELTLADDDREFTLNYKALRSRSGMRHAWARTIHTFQGSEEDTVVYVLSTAGRQNWKHVYTAVTRGRKRVYIIAKMSQLDQAIANKARERKTRLQYRLNTLLQQSKNHSNPTHSPPATKIIDSQTQYPLLEGQDWSPSRAPFLRVPGTPTQRDNGDHPVQADDHNGGEGDSPVQKRTGGSIDDPGTPSKVSRFGSNNTDVSTSPLATASLQNLSIGSPCTKQLKF